MEPTLSRSPASMLAATSYMDLRDVETTSPSPSGALLARCNALSPPPYWHGWLVLTVRLLLLLPLLSSIMVTPLTGCTIRLVMLVI